MDSLHLVFNFYLYVIYALEQHGDKYKPVWIFACMPRIQTSRNMYYNLLLVNRE
jgi:GH15 family glucan-1,4-alpha-glucosidase